MNQLSAGNVLDRLVAEQVMGWERRQDGKDAEAYGAPIFAWYWNDERLAWDTEWYHHRAWAPSTNLADAWTVLTKVNLTWCISGPDHVIPILCVFIRGEKRIVGEGDTVPLAICRAAVNAML